MKPLNRLKVSFENFGARLEPFLKPYETIGTEGFMYFLFGCLSLISTILFLYLFPSVSLNADMFAEEATVYFRAANNKPWTEALLELDAGYRVFLAMITAVMAKSVSFTPSEASIFYGLVAIFLRSLCSFVIILPIFRKLIRADWVRILMGIAILSHNNYDLKTLVNTGYFGLFPVLLTLLLVFKSESIGSFRGFLISFMVCFFFLSKAYFVVFAPSLLIMLAWACYKRNWIATFLAASGLSSIAFQLHTALNHRDRFHHFDEKASFSPIAASKSMLEQVYGSVMGEVGGAIKVATRAHILDVIAWYLIFLLIRHINKNRGYWKKFTADNWFTFLMLTSIIFGAAFVNYYTNIYRYDWFRVVPIPHLSSRHHFFVTASLFFGIVWFLQNTSWPKRSTRNLLTLLFLILSYPFGIAQSALTHWMITPSNYQIERQFSHWYEIKDTHGSVCTPINPYPWTYLCKEKSKAPTNRELQKARVVSIPSKAIEYTVPNQVLKWPLKDKDLWVGFSIYDSCEDKGIKPSIQFSDGSFVDSISRSDRLFKFFRMSEAQMKLGSFSLNLPCDENTARVDHKTSKPYVIYLR